MLGDVLFSIFAFIGFIIVTITTWSPNNFPLNLILILGVIGIGIFSINTIHLYIWRKKMNKAFKQLYEDNTNNLSEVTKDLDDYDK